jgi:PST family polysaccharide transporter/lipopolysaccharide exporter
MSEFGRMLLDQSDYMSLGLFRIPLPMVGIYANGFKFSIQTMRLVMVNMTTILFPAFTKLNNQPNRQYEAFFKAQRILAMVGVSGCLLQAAIAKPFAYLFFPSEWHPSIVIMQILSLGMATRMIAGGSYALLKSQGRFATVRNNFWGCAVAQVVALTAVLSLGGGIVAVSVVVAITAALAGPIVFYVAIRPFGGGWSNVASVLFPPLVCAIGSVGTAWLIGQAMETGGQGRLQYLLQFAVICLVSVVLNALFARLWMRPVWNDLWARLRRMLPQRIAANVSGR